MLTACANPFSHIVTVRVLATLSAHRFCMDMGRISEFHNRFKKCDKPNRAVPASRSSRSLRARNIRLASVRGRGAFLFGWRRAEISKVSAAAGLLNQLLTIKENSGQLHGLSRRRLGRH